VVYIVIHICGMSHFAPQNPNNDNNSNNNNWNDIIKGKDVDVVIRSTDVLSIFMCIGASRIKNALIRVHHYWTYNPWDCVTYHVNMKSRRL
jgi:hypothetical protein